MNGNRILSDRYELREVVGAGGMAVVHRATDLNTHKDVAVKVLRKELMEDEEFVKRFDHEAEAVSHLHHPNIVNLLDVGHDGDVRYLVMEYVNGYTLKDLIRQREHLKPPLAISIAIKILEAVAHAHAHHIIHRDLKPQNILLDGHGTVKVGDFGIARETDSNTLAANSGSVLGSVHYFSPEQARGETAGERSDLYSVAVIIYEMVTGTVPFNADTAVSVALMHVQEKPISPQKLESDVTVALNEVILKGLEKNPDKRYQSAQEMIRDLRIAAKYPGMSIVEHREMYMPKRKEEPHKPRKSPLNPRSRKVWSLMAAALCMLVLIVLALSGVFKQQISTPNFVNMQVTDAVSELLDRELSYTVDRRYSDDVPAGVVMSQSPLFGTMLEKGGRVLLTVSKGRDQFLMPSVTGMDRSSALGELDKYDMSETVVCMMVSDSEPGTVVDQFPAPDTWVQPSQKVTLYISGVCATVPAVGDMTPDEYKAALISAGLEPGAVIKDKSDASDVGSVINVSPSPGTRVLKDSEVIITVGA